MKGKKPKLQLSLPVGLSPAGKHLSKGRFAHPGCSSLQEGGEEFDLLVCFRKALKSFGFLSNLGEELQKISKNPPTPKPPWVLKAFSFPVPEGAVNCRAFQLQKV